jgi:type II restriction enzyme
MKKLRTFENLGVSSSDEVFDYLISSLRPSLKLWDYFVNWDKVFKNTRALEVHLNLWNYLLGKDNFEQEFERLLAEHPQIVQAIPSLIVRDGAKSNLFAVIEDLNDVSAVDSLFDFSKPASTPEQRSSALRFVQESGLIRLFQKDGVKNLVDYVLGVEAGLDSNGRKNRSGTSMEIVVEAYLKAFCEKEKLEYISQATAPKILEKWGMRVPTDKSSRKFDFAISSGEKLILIEVNFYGGGGSKLKATAGEYIGLNDLLNSAGFQFVWVTDGKGWETTLKPLRAAFDRIDFVWNLNMLNSGALLELLKNK